ncbi:MAG: glycosyltransferase family 4 protein, partial [Christensenellaceae bacterium]|nr:glycosyltransferase family 4 protein [Christensenellaceae bacterium]
NYIDKEYTNACIYVGGLSERYGTDLLIETFKILNTNNLKYKLILVCRLNEYIDYRNEFRKYDWVEVHHVSGNELIRLYNKATIALMPLKHTKYNDLAVSIKLFEYMSYGLPIVATSNKAMKEIILDAKCGIITNDDSQSYSNAIINIFENKADLEALSQNALNSLKNNHTWENRALKVSYDLLNKKDNK